MINNQKKIGVKKEYESSDSLLKKIIFKSRINKILSRKKPLKPRIPAQNTNKTSLKNSLILPQDQSNKWINWKILLITISIIILVFFITIGFLYVYVNNKKLVNKNNSKTLKVFNSTYNLPSDGSWNTKILKELCISELDNQKIPYKSCLARYLSEQKNKIIFECDCS